MAFADSGAAVDARTPRDVAVNDAVTSDLVRPTDAASFDLATSDLATLDLATLDRGGVDRHTHDSVASDGLSPDAGQVLDAGQIDVARPDTRLPDQAAPDTFVAPVELCNGVDDNDNEEIDEIFECIRARTTTCTTSCGTTGRKLCSDQCEWEPCVSPEETCNGSDDDCVGGPDNLSGCRVVVYRALCGTDHVYGNSSSYPIICSLELDGNSAWYNYSSQVSGSAFSTTAMFRLYHASIPDHLYTTSEVERSNAIAGGYVSEGNIGYCSQMAVHDMTTPLYRLANGSNGDHFYTTSSAERDQAVAIAGYIFETTMCHVWTSAQ